MKGFKEQAFILGAQKLDTLPSAERTEVSCTAALLPVRHCGKLSAQTAKISCLIKIISCSYAVLIGSLIVYENQIISILTASIYRKCPCLLSCKGVSDKAIDCGTRGRSPLCFCQKVPSFSNLVPVFCRLDALGTWQ